MNELLAALGDIFEVFPVVWLGLIFSLGLLVGSFLNVVIHRVPIMLEREWKSQAQQILSEGRTADGGREESSIASEMPALGLEPSTAASAPTYNLVVPRSACPKCGAMITAAQNIPVISYLFLRGKCANCGTPISVRYPIVELITGVLSAVVA